ncbi:acyl-CoA thioesterase [Actinomadura craniellae]|uniref:Acyl-CoA thioesterase n=1 Tax=Actinomadura craniellae TaxID=2231787 RepID=A0A365H4W9_9ACTN|nr:thioesterase family protein [Actinomadura craniellae]RAY14147.1 acyl-CoA thioesterase [Actinomadura craniellae]
MTEVFSHRLRVRYSECDQQNVVFNGHYLFYFDVAVTELWREVFGSSTDTIDQGYDMVVAEARIRYRHGARFDDLIDISLPVTHLGVTSMVIAARFRVGDQLIADGEIRYVFIDPATKAKQEMPAEVRAALTPYLVQERQPA